MRTRRPRRWPNRGQRTGRQTRGSDARSRETGQKRRSVAQYELCETCRAITVSGSGDRYCPASQRGSTGRWIRLRRQGPGRRAPGCAARRTVRGARLMHRHQQPPQDARACHLPSSCRTANPGRRITPNHQNGTASRALPFAAAQFPDVAGEGAPAARVVAARWTSGTLAATPLRGRDSIQPRQQMQLR